MFPRTDRKTVVSVLLAVAALLAGGSIAVLIDLDGDGTSDKTITVKIPLPDRSLPGDLAGDLAGDGDATIMPADSTLRDERPEGVPDVTLERGEAQTKQRAERELVEPEPVGGAQNYSCRKDFSGRVYSGRGGVRPTMFVLHYTVSPNVRGWGDVLGVQSYFKRTRVGSATYIVDFEGHCLQMVPESAKPWTQGAANPWSISVEIVATGRESRSEWLASPLIKRGVLASLARDSMRRNGIPIRRVDPSGCVFPAGWTDHDSLECGNDHTDVKPAFPFDEFSRQLSDGPTTAPRNVRVWCRKLHWWRRVGRPSGRALENARTRKRLIERRGYECVRGQVVRA